VKPPKVRLYIEQDKYLKRDLNTMGAVYVAGIAYPCSIHEVTPGLSWGSCFSIFSFLCRVCKYVGVLQSGRHHHHYQAEFPPKQLLHTVSNKDNRQILNYTVMILKVLEIKI
jgi:hypothetical protein